MNAHFGCGLFFWATRTILQKLAGELANWPTGEHGPEAEPSSGAGNQTKCHNNDGVPSEPTGRMLILLTPNRSTSPSRGEYGLGNTADDEMIKVHFISGNFEHRLRFLPLSLKRVFVTAGCANSKLFSSLKCKVVVGSKNNMYMCTFH